jgi:hypothetical protein
MTSGRVTALSVVILALSGAIAVELAGQGDQLMGPSGRSVSVVHAATQDRATPAPNETDRDVSEILARPIFNPDRRPIGSTTRSLTGLSRLTGIVVTGTSKIAIFAGPSGGKPIIAEEGSRVNAFEVTSISRAGVTVVGPGGTTVMTPVFDPSPPPVSRPAIRPRPEPDNTAKK